MFPYHVFTIESPFEILQNSDHNHPQNCLIFYSLDVHNVGNFKNVTLTVSILNYY